MLSSDLAELYGVEPKVLVQAVKRNIERFPEDFMFQFQLTPQEFEILKSQFGVELIKSVDDVCHCKSVSDAAGLMRLSI